MAITFSTPGSSRLSRRQLLKKSSRAVTWGAVASALGCALPQGRDASAPVVGATCLTILYQNGDDVSFDYDYYRDHHLSLIMDLYSPAIRRFELRKPVLMEAGPAPAFVGVINIWVEDMEAFAAAGAQHGQTLQADVPNFTNTQLILQNDQVWGESGAGLEATELGQTCLSIFYPYEEGARWDADYYRDNHMTLIMDLYGREAIRRFEVRKGLAQNGNNPPYLGTVNIYIEDQAAFDAAGAQHTQTLVDDVPNFSSVFPMVVTTEIYGIG